MHIDTHGQNTSLLLDITKQLKQNSGVMYTIEQIVPINMLRDALELNE